jgi:zinc D-Ala-D-Ala carboxypeptidase
MAASSRGATGRLSAHFTAAEFACAHCGVAVVRPRLVEVLERLREIVGGKPLAIRSGYRCPVHNHDVGGASNSQHMYGAAADLPGGYCTPAQARAAGAIGVGRQGTWAVHVDVRDGPHAEWVYS